MYVESLILLAFFKPSNITLSKVPATGEPYYSGPSTKRPINNIEDRNAPITAVAKNQPITAEHPALLEGPKPVDLIL